MSIKKTRKSYPVLNSLPMSTVLQTSMMPCRGVYGCLAVPSQAMSGAIADIASLVGEETIVACFSKGLEEKTGLRMSEVIKNMMPWVSPVVLSGPCHAEELARKIPSAYVAASEDMEKAMLVQDIL